LPSKSNGVRNAINVSTSFRRCTVKIATPCSGDDGGGRDGWILRDPHMGGAIGLRRKRIWRVARSVSVNTGLTDFRQ
jgi:hypothetical protein